MAAFDVQLPLALTASGATPARGLVPTVQTTGLAKETLCDADPVARFESVPVRVTV